MKIFIAGGTGFVGTHLIKALHAADHEIAVLVRTEKKKRFLPAGVSIIDGDPTKTGAWQQEVNKADVIINLTGQNIFTRWTLKTKKLIHDSRTISTRNIVDALHPKGDKKITLINTSAAGYYGFCGDEEKYEDASAGNDFLAQVCVDWETEANKAKEKGARVITPRFGIVLGKNGGALAKMLPAFRLGIAGKLGHGRQWFPWIHIDDLTAAYLFFIQKTDISGPINLCAPYPTRNSEFTKTLGKILHRPTLFPFPRFIAKLVLGELALVLFEGNRTMPSALKKLGFTFSYPHVEDALKNLVN